MAKILQLDFADGIEDTSGNGYTPDMETRTAIHDGCCYYHEDLDIDQGVDVAFNSMTNSSENIDFETRFKISGDGWDSWLFQVICEGWGGREIAVFLRRSGGDYFRLYVPAYPDPSPVDLSAYFPSLEEFHVLHVKVRGADLTVYLDGLLIYENSNCLLATEGWAAFRFSGDSLGIVGDGVVVDYHRWYYYEEGVLASGKTELDEGVLKPNIRTSFQQRAAKVEADVFFKPGPQLGSIGFQNHKARHSFSLGSVRIQPIRRYGR